MSVEFIPGDTVELPQIPFEEGVDLPVKKTALVVVDMQNDFVDPEGALYVPAAKEMVPRVQRLLERARGSGVYVVFTQDTHREGDPE